MSSYSYSAVTTQGKEKTGVLVAASQQEALERIKDMGFFPVKVAEATAALSPKARADRHGRRLSLKSKASRGLTVNPQVKIKGREVAVFARQLCTLLQAGMPMLRGLRMLHEQEEKKKFKAVIGELAEGIEGGQSFSEALSRFPRVFDRLFVNMSKAGEVSGALETTLKRLADFMEKSGRIKSRVQAAMFYPAAVVTVALSVMALMLLVIVPKFESVFLELMPGSAMPPFTLIVLGVANFAKAHFLAGMIGLLLWWVAFRLAIRTEFGRWQFDGLKYRLPVLGKMLKKMTVARFTRTLGTLVSSGVPILQSLKILREASGNVVFGRLVDKVHESVEQGGTMADPLRGSRIFPVMVVGMVDVGEQTGALPEMLNRVADTYEEEVDNSVDGLTSLLEPVLIVLLGLVVGCIVIAMMLPLIKIMVEGPGGINGVGGP